MVCMLVRLLLFTDIHYRLTGQHGGIGGVTSHLCALLFPDLLPYLEKIHTRTMHQPGWPSNYVGTTDSNVTRQRFFELVVSVTNMVLAEASLTVVVYLMNEGWENERIIDFISFPFHLCLFSI